VTDSPVDHHQDPEPSIDQRHQTRCPRGARVSGQFGVGPHTDDHEDESTVRVMVSSRRVAVTVSAPLSARAIAVTAVSVRTSTLLRCSSACTRLPSS